MKTNKPTLILMLMLLMINAAGAVVINSGKGLPHTKAAWVSEKGRLTFLSHTRFWGKVHENDNIGLNVKTATTLWNVQGLVGLNYGISDRIELSVTPVLYQDTHRGNGKEYPWDTFINLKIGSFGNKASSMKYGVELNTRFATGEQYNFPYEDYSAGKTEWGFTGLFSYALDPLYPEDSFNLHFNLGYLNHNDVGANLTDNETDKLSEVLKQSQEMQYALGLTIPMEDWDYGFEIYGINWLQQPPPNAASRENYTYMALTIKYKPYRWFNFYITGDYRLSSDKDETNRIAANKAFYQPDDIPNYNTWRINAGIKMVLLPTNIFRLNERDLLMQKAETRRELFEQIIKERRETESAEEELDRIKDERRKAEKELERLRKILEGQTDRRNQLEEMRKELEPTNP